MQATTTRPKITATADGEGVVSHAGSRLLTDVADRTALTAQSSEVHRHRGRAVPAPSSGTLQDPSHGRGTDAVAELEQLALDPAATRGDHVRPAITAGQRPRTDFWHPTGLVCCDPPTISIDYLDQPGPQR